MRAPHPASYSFSYSVDGPPISQGHPRGHNAVLGSTGVATRFGHEERRSGRRTEGVYYVALPDGRLQTVEYSVEGDTGYRAKVLSLGGGNSSQLRETDSFRRAHAAFQVSYGGKGLYLANNDSNDRSGASPAILPPLPLQGSIGRAGRKLDNPRRRRPLLRRPPPPLPLLPPPRPPRPPKPLKPPPPPRTRPSLHFTPQEKRPFRRYTSVEEEEEALALKQTGSGQRSVTFVPTRRPPHRIVVVKKASSEDAPKNDLELLPEPAGDAPAAIAAPRRTLDNFRSGLLLSENGLLRKRGVYHAGGEKKRSWTPKRRLIIKRPRWRKWKKRVRRKSWKERKKAEMEKEEGDEAREGRSERSDTPTKSRKEEKKKGHPEVSNAVHKEGGDNNLQVVYKATEGYSKVRWWN